MQVQQRDIDQSKVGCKAVVESFQPKLADYGPETDLFADQDMGWNMGWIWGHCTTEDGRPHMFARWLNQDEIVTYTWTISSPDLFSQAEIISAPGARAGEALRGRGPLALRVRPGGDALVQPGVRPRRRGHVQAR
jgi:hypothetical protein